MAKKKEKKAGKRMKKKELSKAVLDFFHAKQDEVISLKYIFSELKLTTHPLKIDRKSTRLNSSHMPKSRMPSSA